MMKAFDLHYCCMHSIQVRIVSNDRIKIQEYQNKNFTLPVRKKQDNTFVSNPRNPFQMLMYCTEKEVNILRPYFSPMSTSDIIMCPWFDPSQRVSVSCNSIKMRNLILNNKFSHLQLLEPLTVMAFELQYCKISQQTWMLKGQICSHCPLVSCSYSSKSFC